MTASALRPAHPSPNGEPDRFTLTLSEALPEATLLAWFRGAAAGEATVYASGVSLLAEARAVKLAHRLSNEGKAELTQDRDPANPARRRWWITKAGGDRHGRATLRQAQGERKAELRKLMGILRGCAVRGEACPSYRELAEQMGLGDTDDPSGERARARARYLMTAAERDGRIARAEGAVTILEAGRGCGMRTAQFKTPGEI